VSGAELRDGTPSAPPTVLVVVGTRPEAVKMAPVLEALRSRGTAVRPRLILTGQHTTLVDQVLDVFGLTADRALGIMQEGQSLYDVARGCMDGLREVVAVERPSLLLVQGDTATVFFAALVAFFEGVPVGHVEAGLRTGNRRSPFPEELFRRLTDHGSDLHFAPTSLARENLLREGIPAEGIHVTGNPVVDALARMVPGEGTAETPQLRSILAAVEGGGPDRRRLALLTAHRRESFGEPLRAALGAVRRVVDALPDLEVVFPVHPNPQARTPAWEVLGGHPRIHLMDPLPYPDLLRVLSAASLVLTDSGGIQEEAPTFGVPVLVLREVTERPEGVEAGTAVVVGTDPERIFQESLRVLRQRIPHGGRGGANPFGDGRAGERIADIVVHALTGAPRITKDWKQA